MITNKVTCWREQRGVSKAHLARRIGVSRSYVTRLEQGDLQPSGNVMFRIARYFRCGVGELFDWDEAGEDVSRGLAGCERRIADSTGTLGKAPAKLVHKQSSTLPARPAGTEREMDKSLVVPTAKAVAPLVAW